MKKLIPTLILTCWLLPSTAAYLDLNELEGYIPVAEEVADNDERAPVKKEVAKSVLEGLRLLNLGEYEKARIAFEEGVEGGEAPAFFALGSFYERGYIDRSGKQVDPDKEKAFKYYKGAVQRGHSIAKFNLGVLMLSGERQKEGLALITEVAEGGKINAQNRLGDLYLKGEIIPQDVPEAIKWYKKAQGKGSAVAGMKLGDLYSSTWEGRSTEIALYWYERAAAAGEVKGYLAMSKILLNGPQRNLERAAWCLEQAVEQGDNTTYYNLAVLKENLESFTVALPFYERAAESGHPLSAHRMGDAHAKGEAGMPRNMPRALEHYLKAASKGVPVSMYNAASILRAGDGIKKNEAEALRLLNASARKGYMLAQYDLGMGLQRGLGGQKDPAQATRWFSLAARQGYAPAKFELGNAIERGIGIEKNPKEALTHYLNAARQGLPLACYKMATICLDERLLQKDPVKAYAFLLGIKNRKGEAEKLFKSLDSSLTDWDKVEARQLMVNKFTTVNAPVVAKPNR